MSPFQRAITDGVEPVWSSVQRMGLADSHSLPLSLWEIIVAERSLKGPSSLKVWKNRSLSDSLRRSKYRLQDLSLFRLGNFMSLIETRSVRLNPPDKRDK
jgi:hypothetical protein